MKFFNRLFLILLTLVFLLTNNYSLAQNASSYNIGVQYANNGQYELALPYLEKALKQDPDNSQKKLALVITYYNIGVDAISNYKFDDAIYYL